MSISYIDQKASKYQRYKEKEESKKIYTEVKTEIANVFAIYDFAKTTT